MYHNNYNNNNNYIVVLRLLTVVLQSASSFVGLEAVRPSAVDSRCVAIVSRPDVVLQNNQQRRIKHQQLFNPVHQHNQKSITKS